MREPICLVIDPLYLYTYSLYVFLLIWSADLLVIERIKCTNTLSVLKWFCVGMNATHKRSLLSVFKKSNSHGFNDYSQTKRSHISWNTEHMTWNCETHIGSSNFWNISMFIKCCIQDEDSAPPHRQERTRVAICVRQQVNNPFFSFVTVICEEEEDVSENSSNVPFSCCRCGICTIWSVPATTSDAQHCEKSHKKHKPAQKTANGSISHWPSLSKRLPMTQLSAYSTWKVIWTTGKRPRHFRPKHPRKRTCQAWSVPHTGHWNQPTIYTHKRKVGFDGLRTTATMHGSCTLSRRGCSCDARRTCQHLSADFDDDDSQIQNRLTGMNSIDRCLHALSLDCSKTERLQFATRQKPCPIFYASCASIHETRCDGEPQVCVGRKSRLFERAIHGTTHGGGRKAERKGHRSKSQQIHVGSFNEWLQTRLGMPTF